MDHQRGSLRGLRWALVFSTAASLLMGFVIGGMHGGFNPNMPGQEWLIRISALTICCIAVSGYLIRRIVVPIKAITRAMDRLGIALTSAPGQYY